MNKTVKKIKAWRKNKYLSIPMDVLLILVIVVIVFMWQNRGTLPADGQAAPDFTLTALDGTTHNLASYQGKKVMVYFFAPWCSICKYSADNLNDLRLARSEDQLMILVVALSYESKDAVERFVGDINLNLKIPVLLGNEQQIMDYQIQGFPTYYVVDETGMLSTKSIGYSTEIGLRIRTWL